MVSLTFRCLRECFTVQITNIKIFSFHQNQYLSQVMDGQSLSNYTVIHLISLGR